MSGSHIPTAALTVILAVSIVGCATRPSDVSIAPEAALTEPLGSQEERSAVDVIKRHVAALVAEDLSVVIDTVPEGRRDVFVQNPEQLERWAGFELESVLAGGRWIRDEELHTQYDSTDFTRVAAFHVVGRFPENGTDNVLPEEFDVIVVKDASGKWLVNDMGH